MKPLIGLTAHVDRGGPEDLYPGHPLIYTDRHYIRALEDHEMIPVILPALQHADEVSRYLGHLDGIVLTGGGFLHLEKPLKLVSTLKKTGDERFVFEKALLTAALRLDMPVLGICRGMNSDHHQEIKEIKGSTPTHDMTMVPETNFARMLGHKTIAINSFHRQAIDEIGIGLRVCGKSSEDGVIEALESNDHTWVFGVQFHPEQLYGVDPRWSQLFDGFQKAALAYQKKKNIS